MRLSQPRVLAIIPARGGSKGLPRKNVLLAGGKPLIAWTIESANTAKCVSRIILSSDDEEIINTAKQYNCDVPFIRPAELSTDTAKSIDVVLHALNKLPDFDYVILLQPTSPLRTSTDIDAAFELMRQKKSPSCVSLTHADQSPYWMFDLDTAGQIKPILGWEAISSRRQDLPRTCTLNGAIYIAAVDWLKKNPGFIGPETIGYLMPSDRSLDIDTPEDFLKFKKLVENHSGINT